MKRLVDSELNVMHVLWENGDLTAKQISNILKDSIGWNINTTYTIIKRCIEKGAIERIEPNFICHALVKKEVVQKNEVELLINKMFNGSRALLFASLFDSKEVSQQEIERLKQLIKKD